MSRKIAIELDFHPAILATMCRHAWNDENAPRCPCGHGLKCPFKFQYYCSEVKTEDWEAICLAQEEKEDEA